MARGIRLFIAGILVCALGFPGAATLQRFTTASSLLSVPHAAAQQAKRGKRRSLFSILFGKKKAKKKAVRKTKASSKKRRKKSVRVRRKKTAKRTSRRRKSNRKRVVRKRAVIAAPAKEIVTKSKNAKRILVVGDFFSGGLADGLEKSLSDVAGLVVVDESNGLSGFVRNDIVDWPTALGPLIEETKPSYVIAMLGSNDRQLMLGDGKRLKKRTPEWDALYAKRVESLSVALKASGLPYSWMGLPPVRFKTMNRDFLFFNELYAKAAKSEKGGFIDVWDGFSDAEGNYSRSGPDVNGQITLLRPKDGINLTKAGRSRLSFYVEGRILQTLGGRDTVVDLSIAATPGQTAAKEAVYNPIQSGRTLVVRLDDPSADGGDALAGEKIVPGNGAGQSIAVPVLNALTRPVQKQGRVDDFTWPRTGGSSSASVSGVARSN